MLASKEFITSVVVGRYYYYDYCCYDCVLLKLQSFIKIYKVASVCKYRDKYIISKELSLPANFAKMFVQKQNPVFD